MATSNNDNKRQLKKPIIKKTKPTPDVDINIPSSIGIINPSDDYVSSQWRAQPAVTEFLLRNAYCAMKSSRAHIIFNPYPVTWLAKLDATARERAELLGTDASAVFDYNTMIRDQCVVSNIDIILAALKDSYNDAELLEKLNSTTYELLRFILESNKMLIKADNLLSADDVITYRADMGAGAGAGASTEEQKPVSIESLGLVQFKIEHTQLVEDRFKGQDTIYLYHGSRAENWYSIMCNGLKSGSKSKYFLNGAAHGNGIYLSNDINLSLNYSTGNGIANPGASARAADITGGNMILAIFEVINNHKWHKSGNIYVVDDEDALVLRYLLVFNYSNAKDGIMHGVFNAINRKLNSGGIKAAEKQKKEMETKNITVIHNKRLMREYQAIMKKSPQELGFTIRLSEEDNLGKWMIYLTRPENSKLEEQMQRLRIPAIEIEITFKETYPIAPPFIRVVYPHFKFRSGHITVGGSLCMEMLTNQGWSPTFNVENMITQIKMAICDGEGEIDEVNYRRRYTMDEALDAFKRVLASHGWV